MTGPPSTGAGAPSPGAGTLETIRFPVAGMTCSSCVNRITRSLRRIPGVDRIRVDLRDETVALRRDPGAVANVALVEAVIEAGYTPDLDAIVTLPADDRPGLLGRLVAIVRPAPAPPRT